MKKITLIILLSVFINTNAQDISIVKSEIFKDSKLLRSLKYSLDDSNGGLVMIREFRSGLREKLKGYYIQHFDSKLKLIKEVEYKVDKSVIRNAFIKDNQLHLIEYALNKKQISFNALSADLDNLIFTKKTLLSISEKNQKKYFGISNFPFFLRNFLQHDSNHAGEVIMSENNNYFVINFDINNKHKETHKIFVFNNKFEKFYEHLIQKNIKDKYFDFNSIHVDDNNGTVYFLGKSFENETRENKEKGKTNYHFEIDKIDSNGHTNISFKNDDKFISSLKFIKGKNRLTCIGFYGIENEGELKGVSLINLEPKTLEIQNKKFTPFSKQFLTDKYGNNKKKVKIDEKLSNLDIKNIDLMNNGDIVIYAEKFYITSHTSWSHDNQMSFYTTTHFDDIVCLRLTKEGDLKWARNIYKKQEGVYSSSFTPITVGEDSYLFLNCPDNLKQINEDRFLKKTKEKNYNLHVIRINKQGDINYKKLIDYNKTKFHHRPNNGLANPERQNVVLIGKNKKKTRILKFQI